MGVSLVYIYFLIVLDCSGNVYVCVEEAEGKKGSGQLGCVPVLVVISQQLLGG